MATRASRARPVEPAQDHGVPPASGHEVVALLRRALTLVEGGVDPAGVDPAEAIGALVRDIHSAKAEATAPGAGGLALVPAPTAADGLDALVAHAEDATSDILDAAERIAEIAGRVAGDDGERISEAAALIYQACDFQDLAARRLSKVVATFKHIEETLEALSAALHGAPADAAPGPDRGRGPAFERDRPDGERPPAPAGRRAAAEALRGRLG